MTTNTERDRLWYYVDELPLVSRAKAPERCRPVPSLALHVPDTIRGDILRIPYLINDLEFIGFAILQVRLYAGDAITKWQYVRTPSGLTDSEWGRRTDNINAVNAILQKRETR